MSAAPPGKRMARLAGLLRSAHLFLSMGASIGIAFFALTGLMANLRGGKDGAEAVIPAAALASPEALALHLRSDLRLPTAPRVEEVGPDLFTALADLGEERLDIAVYRSTGAMEVTRWRALPSAMPLGRDALIAWCAERFGGTVEADGPADDTQDGQLVLRIDSVWRTRTVTVDRGGRRWGLATAEHSLGRIATSLHTGQHASWWQRLLMDAIAIALLLSVASGIALGLVWMMKLRRHLLVMPILLGGLLCLLALLVGR